MGCVDNSRLWQVGIIGYIHKLLLLDSLYLKKKV